MLLGCFSLSSRYNSEHVKRWNSKPWEDYNFTLFNNDKYIEQTWQPTYNYKNTNMPIKLNSFLLRELKNILNLFFYDNIPSKSVQITNRLLVKNSELSKIFLDFNRIKTLNRLILSFVIYILKANEITRFRIISLYVIAIMVQILSHITYNSFGKYC